MDPASRARVGDPAAVTQVERRELRAPRHVILPRPKAPPGHAHGSRRATFWPGPPAARTISRQTARREAAQNRARGRLPPRKCWAWVMCGPSPPQTPADGLSSRSHEMRKSRAQRHHSTAEILVQQSIHTYLHFFSFLHPGENLAQMGVLNFGHRRDKPRGARLKQPYMLPLSHALGAG